MTERPITTLLTATLCIVFGLQVLFGATEGIGVIRMGATTPGFWDYGEYWTLLSSTLIHIGLLHLLANAYFTWQIGGVLERGIGGARMLIVFFVGGITGSLLSVSLVGDVVSAGASGGAWALMLALLALLTVPALRRNTRVVGGPVGPILQLIGLNALISLLPGINGLAHLGGGIGGVLALALTVVRIPHWPAAAVLYIAHLGALGWAIFNGTPWDPWAVHTLSPQTFEHGRAVSQTPEGLTLVTDEDGTTSIGGDRLGYTFFHMVLEEPANPEALVRIVSSSREVSFDPVPCEGPCLAGTAELGAEGRFLVAVRSYGDLHLYSQVHAWPEVPTERLWKAVQSTRLTEAGQRHLVETLPSDPDVARNALDVALIDHPGSPILTDALNAMR